MLGSLAAIWLTFLLLGVFFISMVAVSITSLSSGLKSVGTGEVKKGSVLVINLDKAIEERRTPVSLSDAIANGGVTRTQSLSELVDVIYRAAHDSRIKGIYIDSEGSSGGMASLQAINEALNYFKSQPDKWIMAYGDNYSQADYYISSSANEIWLNPQGAVDIHGLSGTTLFYTGLLEKLGVKVQVLRVGTFKSAVEPFILKEMSPASREQQEVYMNSIWRSMAGDIAQNRATSVEQVNQWADDFVFTMPATQILDEKIISSLGYRHEAESHLAELAGKDSFDEVNTVTVGEYAATFDHSDFSYIPGVKSPKSGNVIAVLYAVGEISDSGNSGIVGNDMVDEIFSLIDNSDDLAGLILRVNSPGGSAFASEQIWEALQQFKERTGLPFYVSMGDVAASGGYYISCGADRIYAQPTTITGSIGIFGMIPDIHGLLADKLGITTSTVQTNANGNFPTILAPMSPEQTAKMQAYVERGYETFTARCAAGRHISQDSIKMIAEGRVWDGAIAQKIGLVDRMGSLRNAIADMVSDLSLDAYRVVEYPKVESKWWEELLTLDELSEQSGISVETLQLYNHLERIKNAPRVQCRVETIVIN